ncbi:MAG TPA: carboxypeptidase-like regulatory domain-containing protein [Planctomycetota bacterium]|nr:carboxypeptidase-like regulatory domain-containing protein [Planctomycetota bacterium]
MPTWRLLGLLMVAFAVAVLATWILLGTPVPLAEGEPGAPQPAPTSAPGPRVADAEQRSSDRAAVGDRQPAPERSAAARLRVRVAFDDGQAAGGYGVRVVERRDGRAPRTTNASTGAGGIAVFAALPAVPHVVEVIGAAAQEVDLAAGSERSVSFTVPHGIGIEGRVVDVRGTPVAGATIWSMPGRAQLDHRAAQPVGAAHDDGTFRIAAALPVTRFLAARARGHGASPWRLVTARYEREAATALRGIELRLGEHRAALLVTCFGRDGAPAADADVAIAPLGVAAQRDGDVQLWPGHEYRARTGEHGRVRFDDLCAGTWSVAAHLDGVWFEPREIALADAATAAVSLVGVEAASIAGTMTDERGRPISAAFVRCRGLDAARGTTDDGGDFSIHDLPPARVDLLAFADSFDDLTQAIDLGPGTNRVQLVMRTSLCLTGRARNARGEPASGFQIAAIPVGGDDPSASGQADAEGRFDLTVAQSVPHLLRVAPPAGAFPVTLDRLGPFTPGTTGIEIVVPDRALPSAAIVGVLPPDTLEHRVEPGVRDRHRQLFQAFGDCEHDRASGRFRVGPLPAGTYWLLVQLRAPAALGRTLRIAGEQQFGPYELEPDQALDVGTLAVSMPGQLECALTAATGCEPRDVKLQWNSQASASWGLLQPDAALAGSWPMLPGEYDLTIWGEGFVAVERHITVLAPPAATTRVEATLEPGQRLPLELALPAGETRATFVVRDASGRVAYDDEFGTDEAAVVRRLPVLGRGRHTVQVVGGSGRRFEGAFVVESLVPTERPLRFELRPVH